MNKKIKIGVFIFLCLCLLAAAVKPAYEQLTRWLGEQKWEGLRGDYVNIGSPIIVDPESGKVESDNGELDTTLESRDEPVLYARVPYEIPNLEIDFKSLQEKENGDIYAWIYIPGTKINYAVLQSPDSLDYYLDHNIDGSKGYPGCIYSQLINSKEFTDKNTILYGHNMSNGTMFADLHKYSDEEFLQEHNYCFIYTPTCVCVYQIFAGHMYDASHQILNINISTEDNYRKYLSSIVASAGNYAYDDSVGLTVESKLLTLSTCDSAGHHVRWLVQGVLVDKIYFNDTIN